MIVAKAVIPNRFWILKDGEEKIGNIESGPEGFAVKIGNNIQQYKTINNIKQKVKVEFEATVKNKRPKTSNEVHGFPTTGKAHNAIFDVKHQVPLWTKEPRSKSWYAAGWYQVKQGRRWEAVLCPKLITLQRYPYSGPFHTKEESNDKPV